MKASDVFKIDYTDLEQVLQLAKAMHAETRPRRPMYIMWNGRNYNITMQKDRALRAGVVASIGDT